MSSPKKCDAAAQPAGAGAESDETQTRPDEAEPRTRPETPQSQRAAPAERPDERPPGPPPIVALDVDDVLAPHFADQVRAAHAERRVKEPGNPTEAETREADRWIEALRTMVRHNRSRGPGRIEFFAGDRGGTAVHLLTGTGKNGHASGTLVLASDEPGPIPPPPKPRLTGTAPAAGARGVPSGPRPNQSRALPTRMGPNPPRNPPRR
jgi:hypothetical protein